MVKFPEAAVVNDPSLAVMEYVSAAVITRLLNVAIPLMTVALTVLPPAANAPAPKFRVTVEPSPVTVLLKASLIATVTAGAIAEPAVLSVGGWRNASFVAPAEL